MLDRYSNKCETLEGDTDTVTEREVLIVVVGSREQLFDVVVRQIHTDVLVKISKRELGSLSFTQRYLEQYTSTRWVIVADAVSECS